MKISSVLANKGGFVATVAPTSTVGELIATLAQYQIGAVVVIGEDGLIAGIASERDVARALNNLGAAMLTLPVAQIMTALVASCTPESPVEEIMVVMTEQRVRHLPVLAEDGSMVGIVSIGDVVKARIEKLEDERKSLLSYITS